MNDPKKVSRTTGVHAASNESEHPPPLYPRGRICAHLGCGTRLSIYNESPYCALHEKGPQPPARRNKT